MTSLAELFALPSEAWMADALCAQTDPEAFFPEKGGRITAAQAVCRACPVTAECLQFAMNHNERFGVWGATTERQRRRLRARRDAAKRRAA